MILVTGATGFIGRHLVRDLLDRGRTVRVALRDLEHAGILPPGVDVAVVGDLGAAVQWGPSLRDVRTVVHLAGHAHVKDQGDAQERFHAVNVLGTERLAHAAVHAGVARLVFISSIGAVGKETPPGEAWNEEAPCAPQGAYGCSKLEAERVLHSLARDSGLDVVILRPPVVYGAGVPATIHELFTLLDRGIPLPFGLVRNRRSHLFVGNLVDAIVRVIDAPGVAGQVFHVADGEDLSTADLAMRIARALGHPARIVPVPPGVLLLAGRVGDAASRATRIRLPVNSENVRRLLTSLRLDSRKIRRLLGWVPPWTVDEGLAVTAEWFKQTRGRTSARD